MAAGRSVWTGHIRFSLVTIGVKAYTASVPERRSISLNQLHSECNSRIRYKKTCPIHGEVPNSEIVSGYEFAPDQYVVIDPDELAKLRPKSAKDIEFKAFIKPDAIDAAMYTERSHYLMPDKPAAARPYAVLVKALDEQGRFAFGTVVMHNREQLVVVRPMGKVLMMTAVLRAGAIKSADEFEKDLPEASVPAAELKLARQLTDSMAEDRLDLSEYPDNYTKELRALIEAKTEGKELVTPPEEEGPGPINLMEALQRSLESTREGRKPAKMPAPSSAQKRKPARRRRAS